MARMAASRKKRKPRKPRVESLGTRNGLTVWTVDGAWVRKNLDQEFTNYAHHYDFDMIPKGELWLDTEVAEDERRFYLAHMRKEYRLLEQGVDEEVARQRAIAHERRLRLQAGDLQKVQKDRGMPDPAKVRLRLWKTLKNGVTVWFVHGRLVRSVYDIEFTEGGHEHVYEFIPRDEVWIDDDIRAEEQGYVLFHELHERNLMAKGCDYDKAHKEASRLEKYYRHHPAELHEALGNEGWE
jgi:hypothetical protein